LTELQMERSFKTVGRIAAKRNEVCALLCGPESNVQFVQKKDVINNNNNNNNNKHARLPQPKLKEKE